MEKTHFMSVTPRTHFVRLSPLLLSLVVSVAQWGFCAQAPAPTPAPTLLEARKIWDTAPHNAFTDLVRFQNRWYCVFREGKGHVSPDGAIRVLSSPDGGAWTSQALLTHPRADLRDPKITVTPKQELMLTGAAAWHQPAPSKHQTLAWFSEEGSQWGEPVEVGEPNMWLWRVSWQGDIAYGIGYDTTGEKFIRLYQSRDGIKFEPLVGRLFEDGSPNETSLQFLADQTALCLLRRDGNPGTGQLGIALPPYKEWTWKDLGVKIGGPHWVRLPDGRQVAAVRLYDRTVRTALCWVDVQAGTLREFLSLPSGGDSSYAGLVWHENLLWVSYYSSHEGKTSIYLAKVRM
jgi:hypothetical protein